VPLPDYGIEASIGRTQRRDARHHRGGLGHAQRGRRGLVRCLGDLLLHRVGPAIRRIEVHLQLVLHDLVRRDRIGIRRRVGLAGAGGLQIFGRLVIGRAAVGLGVTGSGDLGAGVAPL